MTAAITFDTLKFAQALIDAGFSEQQAKVLTNNQKQILDESVANLLATKGDIQELKNDIVRLENKMDLNNANLNNQILLIKYMLGIIIGILITLTMKFVFA